MILRSIGTVSAVSNNLISLQLEDGQALSLSAGPGVTPKVGDRYAVQAMPESEAALAVDDLARTMLNQLIANVPHEEA